MQSHFKVFPLLIAVLFTLPTFGQSEKTLAEQLGYSKDAKLLIVHADDLGVAHSQNLASTDAFAKGMVNSGSIMVPCPWFPEIAAYSRAHPKTDLGLHLTLTSEWKNYKWSPVLSPAEVPGLVNGEGFLYASCEEVNQHASPEDVEKEIRAQITRAKAFGINPSHLDTHMGCLMTPDYFPIYLKMGREYHLPVLLPKNMLEQAPDYKKFLPKGVLLIDRLIMANPNDEKNGVEAFYTKVLKSLQPGVTEIIVHLAYDNAEMKAVAIDHPDYGAAWRNRDFDFFTSEACRKLLKQEGIQLITWRKIGQLLD